MQRTSRLAMFALTLFLSQSNAQAADASTNQSARVFNAKVGSKAVKRTQDMVNALNAEINRYEKVPPDHENYIEAQRKMLHCKVAVLKAIPNLIADLEKEMAQIGDTNAKLKAQKRKQINAFKHLRAESPRRLREDAIRVENIIQRALNDATNVAQIAVLRSSMGNVVLTRAELEMESENWAEAEKRLRRIADDHDDEGLKQRTRQKLIVVKVKQGDTDATVDIAKKMMAAGGANAVEQANVANTIEGVLREIARTIEERRYQSLIARGNERRNILLANAVKLAKAAGTLAKMLIDWASQQGFSPDDMFTYRAIYVHALIMSEDWPAAKKALKPLVDEFALDPEVRFYQAEVLFNSTKEAEIIESGRIYDKIITSIRPKDGEREKGLWWNSQVRRLQIYDKLQQNTEQIPKLVQSLISQHPRLGGPAIEWKLRSLRMKYAK